MENRDFVIEQILSLEDFENVDKNLMDKINGNDEYRRLFGKCREVSRLTRESIPEPEKDGVRLCDAVMDRVRSGDTAPRYVNVSADKKFRFPVATAASLIIILAVVVIARMTSGVQQMADVNSFSLESKTAEKASEPAAGGYIDENGAAFMAAPQAVTGAAEESVDDGYAADEEVAEPEEAASGRKSWLRFKDYGFTEDAAEAYVEEAASEQEADYESEKKAEVQQSETEVYNSASDVSAGAALEVELSEEEIHDEILGILEEMDGYGIEESRRITLQDIDRYGRENFLEWYYGIRGQEDFIGAYGIDEFILYCESKDG